MEKGDADGAPAAAVGEAAGGDGSGGTRDGTASAGATAPAAAPVADGDVAGAAPGASPRARGGAGAGGLGTPRGRGRGRGGRRGGGSSSSSWGGSVLDRPLFPWEANKLLGPLLKLRQAACHPQVGTPGGGGMKRGGLDRTCMATPEGGLAAWMHGWRAELGFLPPQHSGL